MSFSSRQGGSGPLVQEQFRGDRDSTHQGFIDCWVPVKVCTPSRENKNMGKRERGHGCKFLCFFKSRVFCSCRRLAAHGGLVWKRSGSAVLLRATRPCELGLVFHQASIPVCSFRGLKNDLHVKPPSTRNVLQGRTIPSTPPPPPSHRTHPPHPYSLHSTPPPPPLTRSLRSSVGARSCFAGP